MLKPWLEASASQGRQNVNSTPTCSPTRHPARGCCTTRCSNRTPRVHERHDLGALALRHCGWQTISYDDVTGKGATRIEFSAVEIAVAPNNAAEDADCTLALHEILHPRINRTKNSSSSMKRSRCASSRCSSGWSATACSSTPPARAQSHESARRCWRSSRGPTRRGAAFQPRLAQADPGDPVRAAEACREEENPFGHPQPTKTCWPSSRWSTHCQAHPGVPRPLEAEIDVHRQAAEERPMRARGASTPPTRRPPVTGRLAPTSPTCRTFPSARRPAASRGVHRAGGLEIVSPTIRRSSCGIMAHLSATRA